MLSHALAVVEAARGLQPTPHAGIPGLWRFGCEPRNLAVAVRRLGEALQAFDRASGRSREPAEMIRAIMAEAAAAGIDVAGMAREMEAGDPVRTAETVPDLKPRPGVLGPEDAVVDAPPADEPTPAPAPKWEAPSPDFVTVEAPNGTTEILVAGTVAEMLAAPSGADDDPATVLAPSAPKPASVDLGRAPLIGSEDAALATDGTLGKDIGEELDAIEDRLQAAVRIVGWTPRMRQLAEKWRHLRERMAMQDGPGGRTYRLAEGMAAAVEDFSQQLGEVERNVSVGHANDAQDPDYEPPAPRF